MLIAEKTMNLFFDFVKKKKTTLVIIYVGILIKTISH
jgi:hypothetical protein